MLTCQTVLANKILGLALLLGASVMVWLRCADRPLLQALVAALILLCPFLVLRTSAASRRPFSSFSSRSRPLVLYTALRRRAVRDVALAAVVGAA